MKNRLNRAFLIVGVAAIATAGVCRQSELPRGQAAPKIAATDVAGKGQTLASLTAKGPVFLYFIKQDCPVNAMALPYYKKLHDAFKGKGNLVGVFNGTKAEFAAWNSEHKTQFPVVLDPGLKVIRDYRAERSPWVVMVDKSGKVANVWPGYSVKELKQIGAEMAKATGTKNAQLAFPGAPSESRYG